jgi:hypothetical protein
MLGDFRSAVPLVQVLLDEHFCGEVPRLDTHRSNGLD